MIHKICIQCGKEFTAGRNSAKYCSDSCKTKASRNKKAREQQIQMELLRQKEIEEQASLKKQEKETRRERNRIFKELKAIQDKELADKQAALEKEQYEKEEARLAQILEKEMFAEKERNEKIERDKQEAKKWELEHKAIVAKRKAKANKYKLNLQIIKGLVLGAGIKFIVKSVLIENSNKQDLLDIKK